MDCTLTDVVDWNAAHYHQVSDPQTSWGLKVLDRLAPAAGERILDVGCGTGRLTRALRERAPKAIVVAIDRSHAMVSEARRTLAEDVPVIQADGVDLPFATAFDAVFSTATFHWIRDHERLFREIFRILRLGGRLISQAGGGPNLARLYERTTSLAQEAEFRRQFAGWTDPYYFADVRETERRMAAAGFSDVRVWLESTPTPFPDGGAYRSFVTTVCLRHQLARLDVADRERYLDRLVTAAAADEPPFTLDYWRLNVDAVKR